MKLQCTNFEHHGDVAPGACAFMPRNVTDTGKLCYIDKLQVMLKSKDAFFLSVWYLFVLPYMELKDLSVTNLMHKFLFSYNLTLLYKFRAVLCSFSGGQIVCTQHLVSSLLESDDTRC
jgi:hypothetical protein